MLFTIVFDEIGTLDTTDIKTAFHACELTHLVSAVLNAETKEVLYGELPDWMLTPEEAKARAEKRELARKRAWADKQTRDALENSDPERKTKAGGITRASVTVRGVKQYDEPVILPMAREWLVVTHADIPTCPFRTDNEQYAAKCFERSVSSKWHDKPFYDEVRLYHNGAVVKAAVLGHEIIL